MRRLVIRLALLSAVALLNIPAVASGLVVEEYKVISKDVDTPDHYEFNRRIDKAVLDKRKQWREVLNDTWSVSYMNGRLRSLGYELIRQSPQTSLYDLCRDGKVVVRNLDNPDHFMMNEQGTKFLLTAQQSMGKSGWHDVLCINGIARRWDTRRVGPIFLGGDLLHIEETGVEPTDRQYFDRKRYAVKEGDQTVYAFAADDDIFSDAVRSFFSYNGNWVLEYTDNVVVSGVNFREKNGYAKMFAYSLLKKKPFYFFEKDGKIGISCGGQVLPNRYDDVIRYKCCEPAAFNVRHNDDMVWFYALKDGYWYYVEAGIYS